MIDGESDVENHETVPQQVKQRDDINNVTDVAEARNVVGNGEEEFDYDEQLIQQIYTNTNNTTPNNEHKKEEQHVATSETSEDQVTSKNVQTIAEDDDDTATKTVKTTATTTSEAMPHSEVTISNPDDSIKVVEQDKEKHQGEQKQHIATTEDNCQVVTEINKNCSVTGNSDNNVICKVETEINDTEEENVERASSEWDDLVEIEPQERAKIETSSTEKLTFQEALQFDSIDVKCYESKIKPTIKRSKIASAFQSILGQKLHKSLVAERNLIFTLALIQFENSDQTHLRILQTIFKTLTKRKVDCARFGPHWELIGFQGNDPATDLRGCGMLSLLMILRFTTASKTKALSSSIYHLSRDDIQNFPFSVMSINITRISLQILREGKLNKECNHRMKNNSQKYRDEFDNVVFDVLQDLYVAIFNKIYTIWKNEGKTMAESGFVVRDAEDYAKSKPVVLIKQFHKLEPKDRRKNSKEKDDKIESFVGIDEL